MVYRCLTMRLYGPIDARGKAPGSPTMEMLLISLMMYLAVGVALFAHPADEAELDDFHWRGQIAIFLSTWRDVVQWPMALLRRKS